MTLQRPEIPDFAIVVGWGLWCTLHSLLISPGITRLAQEWMGRGFRFYRFGYAFVSFVTLIPLIYVSEKAGQTVVFAWQGYFRLIPLAGITVAVILFIAGAKHYDLAELMGFRQMISGSVHRTLSPDNQLCTSGILGAVRHPWYAACFPLLWSRDLTGLSIQINLVLTAYLIVGTLLEERKLVTEFGDHYRDYQRRVPMFFPWKWLGQQLSHHPADRER